MASFIPPIDLGQFTPSAAAITSWLYQVWKYLQENPIADQSEIQTTVTDTINEVLPPEVADAVDEYMQQHPISVPVTSVNGLIGAVVITYASLVTGETTPIYRASSSEITQADLLDAWNDGCRFAVVDDTTVYAILRDLDTFTLLPCGSGGGGSGIESINTTILPDSNGNALVNAANLPMAANDATTISTAIGNAATAASDASTAASNAMTAATTVMTGATSSTAGAAGRVPAPPSAGTEKILGGDGAWHDFTDFAFFTPVFLSRENDDYTLSSAVASGGTILSNTVSGWTSLTFSVKNVSAISANSTIKIADVPAATAAVIGHTYVAATCKGGAVLGTIVVKTYGSSSEIDFTPVANVGVQSVIDGQIVFPVTP